MKKLQLAIFTLSFISAPLYGADFFCSDVTCLIAAINEANRNGENNTISLDPGTYTLQVIDNDTEGRTGLPSITGRINIVGLSPGGATITRDVAAPQFRIFHVAASGVLSLDTIEVSQGGNVAGAAIFNRGELSLNWSMITNNSTATSAVLVNIGRAIIHNTTISFNRSDTIRCFCIVWNNEGEIQMSQVRIEDNRGLGILSTFGSLIVSDTTITRNLFGGIAGSGIVTAERVAIVRNGGGGYALTASSGTISNSTIADNGSFGIVGSTNFRVVNSTVTGNYLGVWGVSIINSIVTGNTQQGDCQMIHSFGYNMFTEPGYTCETQPSDMIDVDPRLDAFQDLPEPGRSHYPLLADSPAIGSANPDACPETDQLGNPRVGTCSRGSIEFQGGEGEMLVQNP